LKFKRAILLMLYPFVSFGEEDFIQECKKLLTATGSDYTLRLEAADPICRKAIEHHPKLAFEIGEKYWMVNDNKKARYYFLAAAKGGIAKGWQHARQVCPYDISSLTKMAQSGDVTAQALLGSRLLDQRKFQGAKKWLEQSAQQGEPLALAKLGWIYASDMGKGKDVDKGMRLLIKALKIGGDDGESVRSLHSISFMKNLPHRQEAYQALVERFGNNEEEWINIAYFIREDPYRLEDPEDQLAIKWFRKAARSKHASPYDKFMAGSFFLDIAVKDSDLYREGVELLKEISEQVGPAKLHLIDIGEIDDPLLFTIDIPANVPGTQMPEWIAISHDDGLLPIAKWTPQKGLTQPEDLDILLRQAIPTLDLPASINNGEGLERAKTVKFHGSFEFQVGKF